MADAKTPKPMPKWRFVLGKIADWLVLVLLLCLVVQVYFAGAYVFADPSYITIHVNFVHAFEMIPVLLALFGFLARDKIVGWSGVLLFVLISLQYASIAAGGLIAAAHAVNALAMFAVTTLLLKRNPPWMAKPVTTPA